jgi:DmsE family decaheme c-type cytochrome
MAGFVEETGGIDDDAGRLQIFQGDMLMPEDCRASRVFLISVICLFFFVAFASGQARQQVAGKDTRSTSPPAAGAPSSSSDASKYVGAETCKSCHEDVYNAWEKTPHWKTTLNKEPSHQGCEGCHGPGAEHVAGGGDKSKIYTFAGAKPEAITKRCLACHESNPEQREFMRSTHNENGITCTNCHSVHHSTLEYLLVKKQTPLCFSCHAEQRADFQKPFHHRVEEGLIKCADCHNAHGASRDRQLRSTPDQDMVCLKCHSDKRGPFVFEHEPVKAEGCQTCHTAHGSPYPRMLLTARVNTLCLQCHTGIPPGPHPQNAFRQDCILCHMSIHGSNIDPRFFK